MKTNILLALVSMLALASLAPAIVVTVDPGTYGSYRADNSQVRAGNYRLWDVTANNWSPVYLGSGDRTGVQTVDLGALVNGNTYQLKARDANVVIGSFVNTGGTPTSVSGSVSLVGSTINFVTHNIAINSGIPGWGNAQMWSAAWGNRDIARYSLPAASSWGGWYGNLGDNNLFNIAIAANGMVSVNSDSRGIGIAGGLNELRFPSNNIVPLLYTSSGTPPGANWAALDWATGNLPFGGSTSFSLYAGQYSFASGLGGGTWTPLLTGGNYLVPKNPNYNSSSWVFHSTTNGLDYTFTFTQLIPEPSTALLLGLAGAGIVLRRRQRS